MFFWVFVFSLPIMYIYGSGRFLENQKSFPISRFFIGNFGGSTMLGKTQRIASGGMQLECPKGTVFEDVKKA